MSNNALTLATEQADPLAFIENPSAESLQAALAEGNLSKLSTPQRLQFLAAVSKSIGLNPLSSPFEFITFQGKIRLYVKRDATDQLRRLHNVSIEILDRAQVGDVLVVKAKGTMPSGRCDESIGAVPVKGLSGEALAIALMKGETKAKRRVTLSICGLGFLDESEIEDAKTAEGQMHHHQQTGRMDSPKPQAEGMIEHEAEVLPPEDTTAPRHWSDLMIEKAYQMVKFPEGSKWAGLAVWEIVKSNEFEAAFKEVPHTDCVERHALDAVYFSKLTTRLSKKGYDLDEAAKALQKAEFLESGKDLYSVPGERLLDLGTAINDLPKLES